MEAARFSYTSVKDYMDMTFGQFRRFLEALNNVLDRERAARNRS